MVYLFKLIKRKWITLLFIGILVLLSEVIVAYSVISNDDVKENGSFVVYSKEDGLYYSYFDNKNEVKIHEGKAFTDPLIAKGGNYIAYTKDKSLYVYDVMNKSYEKIAEKQDVYQNFYEWIGDEIVYSTDDPGFTIYNPLTKEVRKHLDELYYDNFKSSNNDLLYARQNNRWSTDEGDFNLNLGIVEVNLDSYNKTDSKFEMEVIIEGKRSTESELGYNPIISKITADGRYVFIMERVASGSISADYAGIGLYDTKEKIHIDLTNRALSEEFTYGEEDEGLVVLPIVDNIAINPKDDNLIGIIKGGLREPYMNKEIVLLKIKEDKSNEVINFMDKKLVAMTPSFTLDGSKLLYSATKAIDYNDITTHNKAYSDWRNQPHNIYEYDLNSAKVRKLTAGNEFDFMPINISKDEILIRRFDDDQYGKLIMLVDGNEEIVADGVIMECLDKLNTEVIQIHRADIK